MYIYTILKVAVTSRDLREPCVCMNCVCICNCSMPWEWCTAGKS